MPPADPKQSAWYADELRPHESLLRAWLQARFISAGEVDDIVQETYLRAIQVRERGALFATKAFLFKTARNLAIDRIRRSRRSSADPVLADSEVLDVIDDTATIPDQVARTEEIVLLNHAIASLPPQCREIFVMRRIRGKSHKEIAEAMGLSLNTVSAQLTIGLRKCSEFFERQARKERTEP